MILRPEFHVETRDIQCGDHGENANIVVNRDWGLNRHRHRGNGTDTDQRQDTGQSKDHGGNDSIFNLSLWTSESLPVALELHSLRQISLSASGARSSAQLSFTVYSPDSTITTVPWFGVS